jgi:predicted flavoprotein YhiN
MNQNFIIIVGGGAAGFFTAINIVEKNPKLKVAILDVVMYFRKFVFLVEDVVMLPMLVLNLMSW